MKNTTKAIIAVIVLALVALGYFYINTTIAIETTFKNVGRITVLVLVIVCAIAAIVLIFKAKQAKKAHDEKKARRKELKDKRKEEKALK